MARGIVVGAHHGRDAAGRVTSFNGGLDNRDLVRWLLYWDWITYAGLQFGQGTVTGNHTDDVKFLESAGVFRTEVVDVRSLDLNPVPPAAGKEKVDSFVPEDNLTPAVLAAARIKLVEDLSKRTGEIWALGQSGGEQLVLPGGTPQRELIDIQMVNCLPVPAGETPFEDILSFRARHQSELERLRYVLDRLRETILSSSDEQRATMAAIHEISRSLTDMHKALRGSGIRTVTDSVALYTNNPSLGFWTSIGGVAAASQGLPVEFGAAVGLAVPTAFRFLVRTMEGADRLPYVNSDFAYAFEVVQQLR